MKPLDQRDEIQAYYTDRGVAGDYLRRRTAEPLNGFLHRMQVGFLNRVVREMRPGRVLEIAPGPARLTAELEFDGDGVAIDFSPAMLAKARSRLAGHKANWLVLRGDAFALPFTEHSFDLVYSLKFIRHFQLPDRRRLYDEVRRVLRPDGAFALDAQNRAVSLPHRQRKGLDKYPIYDVLYDREELVRELEESGFRVLRVEGILNHFPLQQRMNRLRRLGLAGVARTLIPLLDALPGRNPSTWMILNRSTNGAR